MVTEHPPPAFRVLSSISWSWSLLDLRRWEMGNTLKRVGAGGRQEEESRGRACCTGLVFTLHVSLRALATLTSQVANRGPPESAACRRSQAS